MKSIFLLLFLFLFFIQTIRNDDDICKQYVLAGSGGTSLGYINGKCIAINTKTASVTVSGSCRFGTLLFDRLSIDSKAENDFVKDGLLQADATSAYIGYYYDGTTWLWGNGDTSTYNNWKNPPPVIPVTTVKPVRSTLPPAQQRRGTAVVIAVDASLFSTNAFTFAQTNFVQSLSTFIGDRGPAEFAFFVHGCSQTSPWIDQYPSFVSTFEDTDQMIKNLNDTIINNCVRTNPLDFLTVYKNLQTVYYNRWSGAPRPFKSPYLSIILFGSTTDYSGIQTTPAITPISQSSIITVTVGSTASDLGRLAIPYLVNGIRVSTPDDIRNLVPRVDAIIFGSGVTAGNMEGVENTESLEDYAASVDATTYTECAYMNSSDSFWYSDPTCSKGYNLCQYTIPTPVPPPTPNPTAAWSDPCFYDENQFLYFKTLNNAKCYRLSQDKRQFAQAEDECLTDHPLFIHSPKLTSVQTIAEQNQLDTMVATIPDEGMFWVGLRRDPTNNSNWYFINGDTYDPHVYNNWRDGYPRDADGCDCVAYVINDKKWVNTDCNKQLYAICAYQFNQSISTQPG